MVRNFLGRFPENPETVKTIQPKTQKKKKNWRQNRMGLMSQTFLGGKCRSLGIPYEVFLFFGNFGKMFHFGAVDQNCCSIRH